MADFSKFFPTLLNYEGGYVNDPSDRGGRTKYGVTEAVWKATGSSKDIKDITPQDAFPLAKKKYWDVIKGDDINSQSVAEFIMDWAYMSGPSRAIKKTQGILNLTQDGVIGQNTLGAINKADSKNLFEHLKVSREKFFRAIVANNPSQSKFLKGWLNRNNSFKFKG